MDKITAHFFFPEGLSGFLIGFMNSFHCRMGSLLHLNQFKDAIFFRDKKRPD